LRRPTAAADGPVNKGKFRGKTSKGDPMGVSVDGQSRVVNFFVEGVKLKCNDGYSFNTPTGRKHRIKNKFGYPLGDDRRWLMDDSGYDPYGVYIDNGQFNAKGSKTTGQIHVNTFISKDHKTKGPYSDGRVGCDSGPMTFTLRRQKPK
jgi:hypothetical protein